jgi:glycoside hydrolase-like protein
MAIADYLETCLTLGELEVPGDFIYVYLEVDDGVQLSPDYWASWCGVHFNFLFTKDTQIQGVTVPKIVMPFLPGILCSFKEDANNPNKYVLDDGVKACLDKVGSGPAGARGRCYGFWASATGVAAYHASEPQLDWSRLTPYEQPLGKATEEVPFLLWRYMERDPQNPVPQIGELTLDATRETAGTDTARDGMLTVKTPWSPGKPSTIGVGKGADLRPEIGCILGKQINITHLPDVMSNQGAVQNPAITGRASFVLRYYSTERADLQKRAKDISKDEARALSRRGVSIVATWQGKVLYKDVPVYLSTAGHGREDARNAFTYAANLDQPAYTPVYFAVDTDVKTSGNPTPVNPGQIPTPAQIQRYFEDIQLGYLDYLGDIRNPTPYYTGVYGGRNVLEMCYLKGLATHYWQAWPHTWGEGGPNPALPNIDPWPHANGWQVSGQTSPDVSASDLANCRQTSLWFVRMPTNWAGTYRLQVDASWSAPIPSAATAQDAAAAADLVTPATVTGTEAEDAQHRRVMILEFSKKVDLHIEVPVAVDAEFSERPAAFIDLEVAWGDPGGWKLR